MPKSETTTVPSRTEWDHQLRLTSRSIDQIDARFEEVLAELRKRHPKGKFFGHATYYEDFVIRCAAGFAGAVISCANGFGFQILTSAPTPLTVRAPEEQWPPGAKATLFNLAYDLCLPHPARQEPVKRMAREALAIALTSAAGGFALPDCPRMFEILILASRPGGLPEAEVRKLDPTGAGAKFLDATELAVWRNNGETLHTTVSI